MKSNIELDDTLDVRFTYDNNGNMTSKTEEYGTGNERTTTYHWNDRNLLKQIDFPDSTTAYITYDGLGRPVKIVYESVTRKFVFLGANIVQEYNGSDSLENEYVTNVGTGDYIYGKDDSSNYYYYHFDKDRDVAAITDGSKDLEAWYEYDHFGNIVTDADSTDNDFRYGSAYWDEKSKLLYMNDNYYSAEIGRYLRRLEHGKYTAFRVEKFIRDVRGCRGCSSCVAAAVTNDDWKFPPPIAVAGIASYLATFLLLRWTQKNSLWMARKRVRASSIVYVGLACYITLIIGCAAKPPYSTRAIRGMGSACSDWLDEKGKPGASKGCPDLTPECQLCCTEIFASKAPGSGKDSAGWNAFWNGCRSICSETEGWHGPDISAHPEIPHFIFFPVIILSVAVC